MIEIALDNLEEVLLEHSSKFQSDMQGFQKCRNELAKAKYDLSVQLSKTELAVRTHAKESGEKLTEAMVKARVATEQNIIDAENHVIDIQCKINDYQAIKDVFSAREFTIKSLIELFKAQYWTV